MHPDSDRVLDADLIAYVDGQLDAVRRVEVERYLSHHPDMAVKVLADLHVRNELRLALLDATGIEQAGTAILADQLRLKLKLLSYRRPAMQAVAAVLILCGGLLAQSQFDVFGIRRSNASAPPPAFVSEALESYTTATLRNGMPSQLEVKRYDRGELRAATAIAMPALPEEWTIDDVQVFPSTFGPSVSVAMETHDIGRVALYAARPGTSVNLPITTAGGGEVSAAFWQEDDVAYALIGSNIDHGRLLREAGRVERSLP